MQLRSVIDLHAHGEAVRKDPRFWERFKRRFGGRTESANQRERSQLTTAHLVQGAKTALAELGVTNAVGLVLDGQILFEDKTGADDDLDALFVAFHDAEAGHERELNDLRLTAEHDEGDMHIVIAVVAHAAGDEATAQVEVSGEVAGARAASDFTETHRLAFEGVVERLRNALGAALPDVRVTWREPEARVAGVSAKRKASEPEPARELDAETSDADPWSSGSSDGGW